MESLLALSHSKESKRYSLQHQKLKHHGGGACRDIPSSTQIMMKQYQKCRIPVDRSAKEHSINYCLDFLMRGRMH